MINTIDNIYAQIGSNLKQLRVSRNMNQGELAQELGLSRVSISNIEKGKQRPTIHFLFEVMILFNVKMGALFPVDLLEQEKSSIRIQSEKPKTAEFIQSL